MMISAAFAGAGVAGAVADISTIPTVYGVAAALTLAALLVGGRQLSRIRLEFDQNATTVS